MPFTVAIMQPYFLPYAGYFRLLAHSDLFVLYDDVQFPRRGWVHRNRLRDRTGALQWLTLPLAYAPREAAIRELAFAPDAPALMAERTAPFPIDPAAVVRQGLEPLVQRLLRPEGRPVDHIAALMQGVCARLDLPWRTLSAGTLAVAPEVHGQQRILEICRRLGAERYLNAPGGRELYDAAAFARAGVELAFLPPHPGPPDSILQRLLDEDPAAVRAEILAADHG